MPDAGVVISSDPWPPAVIAPNPGDKLQALLGAGPRPHQSVQKCAMPWYHIPRWKIILSALSIPWSQLAHCTLKPTRHSHFLFQECYDVCVLLRRLNPGFFKVSDAIEPTGQNTHFVSVLPHIHHSNLRRLPLPWRVDQPRSYGTVFHYRFYLKLEPETITCLRNVPHRSSLVHLAR